MGFLPNTNGVNSPSRPLLNELSAKGIDINVFTYHAGDPADPVNVNPTGDPDYDKIGSSGPGASAGLRILDDLLGGGE